MVETILALLAGFGLSIAAGLNAYIPLLILGVGDRLLDAISLPAGWSWLANEWVIAILIVLLLVEVVADKIPAVDSVNDWIQLVVRPTSGGIVFGGGATAETVAVRDPEAFITSNAWVPVVIGIVVALLVHIAKASLRPALNAVTFGLAAPVTSAIEDVASVVMSLFAILAPVLVVLGVAGLVAGFIAVVRRTRRVRAERRATRSGTTKAGPRPDEQSGTGLVEPQ